MVPRGEVGLIFASIGKGLGVVDDATFSAVVMMVIATTLMTPPLLKFSIARGEGENKRQHDEVL
jgi:Kef-type K+ transport system membrane component KefB